MTAWQWLAVHLSQETGSSNEASRAYAYWSGFGSVFPWSLGILAAIGGAWHHKNCHVKGCWRLGKHPVSGTDHVVCRKHHPDDAPSAQQVLDDSRAAQTKGQ